MIRKSISGYTYQQNIQTKYIRSKILLQQFQIGFVSNYVRQYKDIKDRQIEFFFFLTKNKRLAILLFFEENHRLVDYACQSIGVLNPCKAMLINGIDQHCGGNHYQTNCRVVMRSFSLKGVLMMLGIVGRELILDIHLVRNQK